MSDPGPFDSRAEAGATPRETGDTARNDIALHLKNAALEGDEGRVLFDVDELEVLRGEVLSIIGPNGAGKSSLLKVLGLLEPPLRGELFFDGEQVAAGDVVAQRRRTATVFQEPLLYDTTVRENVAAGLKFRHVSRAEIAGRVTAALDTLGVAHLGDRKAKRLSGGEAQRVSLARALVLEPEVFLLDEPFGGLDPGAARKLLEDLRHLVHERAITTIFVTHDRTEALAIADRVAVMMSGRIAQVGPVQEVFARPATAEVASFVGVETVLSGTVLECENDGCVVDVRGEHILSSERGFEGDVFVCVRPEDVTLVASDAHVASSARNRFTGTITALELVGPHYRVELDCGFPLVCLVTKTSVQEMGLKTGADAGAMFKATAVHLLRR